MVTFSLDDNQLRQICVLAEPPPLRSELSRTTTIELGGKEPGDSTLFRAARVALTKVPKAERFDAMKPQKFAAAKSPRADCRTAARTGRILGPPRRLFMTVTRLFPRALSSPRPPPWARVR